MIIIIMLVVIVEGVERNYSNACAAGSGTFGKTRHSECCDVSPLRLLMVNKCEGICEGVGGLQHILT